LQELQRAEDWLRSLIDVEKSPGLPYRRLGLEPIRALLERLGSPERGLSILHVAGSKGKGSTALFAEGVLQAAGERTGVFTSPHLERWTERFRIGGQEVAGADLADAVATLRPHVEALRADPLAPTPTFFDAITAAAFLLFRDAAVERVVLEVGLGGRLDSTNVVDPAVAVVTAIELEHTDRLGTTLGAIAGEKAGIVKPGRPVVMGRLPPEAAAVVRARAAELGAPLSALGSGIELEARVEPALGGVRMWLRDGPLRLEARLATPGLHQAGNAALAVAAVRRAADRPLEVLAEAARSGLERTRLPGRIEVLAERPWLVVDAAHTPRSAEALAGTLAPLARGRTRVVLSVSSDKDLEALLRALLPLADELFVTRAEPVRSLDPALVARAVRTAAPTLPVHAVPNPHLAVRAASEGLGQEDLLLATGSVYLAGIARRILAVPRP